MLLDYITLALEGFHALALMEEDTTALMRPLHGTGGDPGLFHLRIFLIFSIFMDKTVV